MLSLLCLMDLSPTIRKVSESLILIFMMYLEYILQLSDIAKGLINFSILRV